VRNALVTASLLAVLGSTAGCARRMPPRATPADAERAHIELAELERGRELVVSRCGSRCHKPPLPTDKRAGEWPHAIEEMAERANINTMERQLIQQYLIALATP